jgi:hypothetical protein
VHQWTILNNSIGSSIAIRKEVRDLSTVRQSKYSIGLSNDDRRLAIAPQAQQSPRVIERIGTALKLQDLQEEGFNDFLLAKIELKECR